MELDKTEAPTLLLASGNAHKLKEFAELCAGMAVRVLGPADWQTRSGAALPEVEETGATFLANALLKAASACRATGLTCVADDSGLAVQALGGAPGVLSARFAGPEATDAGNRALLLQKLEGVTDRRAAFHCALVVCGPLAEGPECGRTEDGLAWRAFAGQVQGRILTEERGEGGFGYDALFHHDGLGLTFAEASPAQKHALSHRGHAFAQLRTWLAFARKPVTEPKPLFVRPTGLQALGQTLERTLQRKLRYADVALDAVLEEQPSLGSKERAALGQLHWHGLRRLGMLQLAVRAVAGDRTPTEPLDPRTLTPRDAPLLASLTLTDVDTFGTPRDHTRKSGPASLLTALVTRTPQVATVLPPDRLDSVMRAASYAVREMSDDAQNALNLGYPLAFWQACREELGETHARAALTYLNGRGPLAVRANLLKTDRDTLAARLHDHGIETVPLDDLPDALLCLAPARLTKLPEYLDGWFEVQDEGSQRIVAALDVQPGETVLDWCAGAGGKTLALAAALRGEGTLIALDTHAKRLEECERRLERAGCPDVRTQQLTTHGVVSGLPQADAVLIDAPCTSSGALRRNPELRWHLDRDWLTGFAPQQLAILRRAAPFVKPGGRLAYATCSILRREDEDVVGFFLQEARHFRISHEHRMGPADPEYLARHPLAHVGPDGFYCCVLRRDP
jgi:16S rRNA (cytosine967-C5)-methyltransferase